MFALLGLVFPLIKGLLGDGLVEKYLNHKKAQAETASAERKANLDADVKVLEFEVKRRDTIKELQLKEYEHPLLWWPKFILMLFVCLYWAARFMVKLTGLNDFNVAIAELSTEEAVVSSMVLGYLFLANKIERVFTKK